MAEPTAPVRGIELPTALQRARNSTPTSVRHALRTGARAYGTATASLRPTPDFLIIGAKKAGTSSLMNWLLKHPAVPRMVPAAQRVKSPHYFDINYWRGQRWYVSHFPSRFARHRKEKRLGALTVVGEASPYYMFHPAVPGRVVRDLPDVRVIVLLRDPVARAYSNYWDRRAFGTEDLPTFEQAIEAEPARLATVDDERLAGDPAYYSLHHDHHSYLARGRYAEHLRPWVEQIDPERLLILRAEDLYRDATRAFTSVQEFLRLPTTGSVDLDPYNSRRQPPIDPQTRAALLEYFRPHNADLYDLIERDLGWDHTTTK
ncbi:MAG: sulfotransferase domain-containing protein [Nocardioidaceae bacterium]|nr:sulfotransferase domain-containing protein [Nocardioidaceae bacterium]